MLQRLAEAIARMEGFYRAGAIPARLNNPGDLIYAHQAGATPHPIKGADGKIRTYAEFVSAEAGWEALRRQIRLDAGRGLTLLQFVHKYAPASDGNDPKGYAAYVAWALGVGLDTPLSELAK